VHCGLSIVLDTFITVSYVCTVRLLSALSQFTKDTKENDINADDDSKYTPKKKKDTIWKGERIEKNLNALERETRELEWEIREIDENLATATVPIVKEELKRRQKEVQAKLNKNFVAMRYNRKENALTAILAVGILLLILLGGIMTGKW